MRFNFLESSDHPFESNKKRPAAPDLYSYPETVSPAQSQGWFRPKTEFILKVILQFSDRNSHLLHGIAVTDRNCMVFFRIKIVRYAEWCSDLILSSVTLADVAPVVKFTVIIPGKLRVNLLQHPRLASWKAEVRRSSPVQSPDGNGEPYGHLPPQSLPHRMRNIRTPVSHGRRRETARLHTEYIFLSFIIKIRHVLTGCVLMLRQVVIRSVRNTPSSPPSKRE